MAGGGRDVRDQGESTETPLEGFGDRPDSLSAKEGSGLDSNRDVVGGHDVV